jgi:hypothetical protein
MGNRGSAALGQHPSEQTNGGDASCNHPAQDSRRIDWRAVNRALALLTVALCAALLAACGGGGGSSSSTSTAALSTCDINGRQQSLGASYVTSIQVAGVDCGQAEEVVIGYHHCRRQNGGVGGTCKSEVAGFRCTEGSRQSVPGVQYNATVDCHKGGAEIKSSYTQNF